jgi:MFS family permease
VQLKLLRDGTLSAGLLSMVLVSAIMMATLVVGPFYLSGVLGLQPVETGMVMSIGPGVAALTGVPAGRLVDRLGATRVVFIGLGFVAIGSVLMAIIPGTFGVGGYVGGLALITFGYALYQAANNTAVMNGAAKDLRGVTSALLGLSRNLGLIFGASAMGALFALGARSAGAASHEFRRPGRPAADLFRGRSHRSPGPRHRLLGQPSGEEGRVRVLRPSM